ncbi:S24/S26 family peptidase [Thermodesulforhabdus norvegica]|uniref:S24 family peptidase n=1 Tax=Thermodesulforhabdus norvegica TaxID=39841 RepID=UPI001160B077
MTAGYISILLLWTTFLRSRSFRASMTTGLPCLSKNSSRLEIKNGKIYLVRLPDGAISVKRVVLLKENQRLLCQSDNPIYEPFEFNIDPAKGIKWYILGRIRWVGREID